MAVTHLKHLTAGFLLRLTQLPLPAKHAVAMIADSMMLPAAFYAGYILRLGEFIPSLAPPWWLFPLLPAICLPILAVFGVYRVVVRFIGLGALVAITQAMFLATLALGAVVFAFSGPHEVPRSVLPIFFVLSVIALGGGRLLFRELLNSLRPAGRVREPVAIYGAGEAGRQLATALAGSHELVPVLFLDDQEALHGRQVQGLTVHAPSSLDALVTEYQLSRVLIAMPAISRSRQREILEFIEPSAVKVMVMPGLSELAQGHKRVDDLREVDLEDLLGRETVAPDPKLLHACIRGKNVMVTGAGGSIGAELCRQILQLEPSRLVLLDHSESVLYSIESELRALGAKKSRTELVPVLGSVRDRMRMETAVRQWGVTTVYHAAAYKHVPLVEHNPLEGLRNNVFGTLHAARAARAAGVETFVLVSTDKAVRPTNVMGASKRLAEMVLQAMAAQSHGTRFCMVRFGNVLESSGSVVPLFRQQIRCGGPVTVTHPEVLRYFMTIPEAAQLVIQAGSMGRGGEVFVLDMGEPVRIVQLAERMIHLSGLTLRSPENPNGDIEIVFTGLRSGEKLYEELLISDTDLPTSHPRIRCAQEEFLSWETFEPELQRLEQGIERQDMHEIRALLKRLVHGYEPEQAISDIVRTPGASSAA